MDIKENESLEKYTTFRMGGTAKKMYFPETVEELQTVLSQHDRIGRYIIGGGSNLLINDEVEFSNVLCMLNFQTKIKEMGEGTYYVGAGVRLQALIRKINEDGYGGIEYLYSVPGLIGGAVFMNAGRGRKYNCNISDYIEQVDYMMDGQLCSAKREECDFSYRHSKFQDMQYPVIVGVLFRFDKMEREESERRRKERIDLCKANQDMSAPNFGTVFCMSNGKVMNLVRQWRLGKKSGIHFSGKTSNWLLKGPEGNYRQAKALLKRVARMHKLVGKKCVAEVRMWDE